MTKMLNCFSKFPFKRFMIEINFIINSMIWVSKCYEKVQHNTKAKLLVKGESQPVCLFFHSCEKSLTFR